MVKDNSIRSADGRYDFGDYNLLCRCGHRLGIHAAKNESKRRPCFNEDSGIEGATGEPCDCPNYRRARRKK